MAIGSNVSDRTGDGAAACINDARKGCSDSFNLASLKTAFFGLIHNAGLRGAGRSAFMASVRSSDPVLPRFHWQLQLRMSDGEDWEKAFNDSLLGDNRQVPEYSHLQVSNADLAREFPFLKNKETELHLSPKGKG
jgi:hypothetical protein